MDLVDELYTKINKTIVDVPGKIFVPISGGLDSRVLAGIISRRRQIDLSYVHFVVGKDARHVQYSAQIAAKLDIKDYLVIPIFKEEMDDYNRQIADWNLPPAPSFTAYKKLSQFYDLKEYTLYMPHGMEYITGIHLTPFELIYPYHDRKITDWFLNTWRPLQKKAVDIYKQHFFKDFLEPTWDDGLINFCLDLPLKYRVNQYLYRKMIVKYFPELASIPREVLNYRIDTNEVIYTINRLIYSLKKVI